MQIKKQVAKMVLAAMLALVMLLGAVWPFTAAAADSPQPYREIAQGFICGALRPFMARAAWDVGLRRITREFALGTLAAIV